MGVGGSSNTPTPLPNPTNNRAAPPFFRKKKGRKKKERKEGEKMSLPFVSWLAPPLDPNRA